MALGRWGKFQEDWRKEGAQREGSLGGRIILSASFSCRASQGTCPWLAMAQQDNFLWLLTLPVPWDVSHQPFVLLGMGNGGCYPLIPEFGVFPKALSTSSKGAFAKCGFVCGCKLRSCGIM